MSEKERKAALEDDDHMHCKCRDRLREACQALDAKDREIAGLREMLTRIRVAPSMAYVRRTSTEALKRFGGQEYLGDPRPEGEGENR